MEEDPFSGCGLRPVELTDQAILDPYFKSLGHSLSEPLSDYTFSQLFTWRNSLRLLWKIIDDHLCVFANGSGDLTLLMPPLGDSGGAGSGDRALRAAFEIMDQYNGSHGVPLRSRVEYASEGLLQRFDCSRLSLLPMGADYVYDTQRMIDLAGGDLASKRQAKNRFMRNYAHRVEPYDKHRHFEGCCALLENWRDHQDVAHVFDGSSSSLKRQKESLATKLALEHAAELNLTGLVVYVADPASQSATGGAESLLGFTFGEPLGTRQSSIVIEKTDLRIKGLAQFIFSDFCQRYWSHLPLVNVGDDWGLETLAWTKQSYRPVKLLRKYILTQTAPVVVAIDGGLAPTTAAVASAQISDAGTSQPINIELGAQCEPQSADQPQPVSIAAAAAASAIPSTITLREARKDDLGAAVQLEQACFNEQRLNRRQLQYLQTRPSAIFWVAEQTSEEAGDAPENEQDANDRSHTCRIVGEGIALVRHHKTGKSGRIYSLAVAAESRGQKVGKRLLAQLITELQSRGVKRIYLEVEKLNTAAINLYESFGFRVIGLLPDYFATGQDALHMMYDTHTIQIPMIFEDARQRIPAVAAR